MKAFWKNHPALRMVLMLVLFVLGDNLERALGKIKYLLFYLLCGVGANAVSMLFDMGQQTHAVSAGASGAIFGVIGGLLYAVLVNRGRLEDLSSSQLIIMIIFSLYLGFTSTGCLLYTSPSPRD